ncbi:hypothetical protein IFM89_022681 [Coptis chinensis]|uniref:Uncharacterized protein n=1 Tax=Coptis chinensis TaxID=261450 RepID=A0A835HDM8_9MAGN|nr:hypothetical protein IFM89_022681 [Coptis chinensis]
MIFFCSDFHERSRPVISAVLMAAIASRVENRDAIDAYYSWNVGPIQRRSNKDESIAALPIDDLIEKVDGFVWCLPRFHHNSYCGKLPSSLRVIHLHHLKFGFMLLALLWKFDFPPFMVLIIAIMCHVLTIEHCQMDWRNGILGKAQQERRFLVDLLSFIRNYVSLHD